MRIALVNDVRMALEALRRIVATIPAAQVAWVAEDGEQAVARCREDTPDLILMDMIMPGMDGVEATRQIMESTPCPILVVTATVTGNAARVYEALGHGALDAVNTPVLGTDGNWDGAEALICKIDTVRRLTTAAAPSGLTASLTREPCHESVSGSVPMVAIGASTGGPKALIQVLAQFPQNRSWCTAIVQHVDPFFAPGLAEWLTTETGKEVVVVQSGQLPEPGTVYLAATADHLEVDPCGQFRYVREPEDQVYRPSVDVFFRSLLTAPVTPGAAVLLTGMGRDGAEGLQALRQAGWPTIAQDEATSVIWGMPAAAVRIGAVEHLLPIQAVGGKIERILSQRNSANRSAS
ncbi:MAG: chemotaxis-specific protein-glutamate methyltransferase CheB [Pirellulales bacterium]